jgi:hypothetical protein
MRDDIKPFRIFVWASGLVKILTPTVGTRDDIHQAFAQIGRHNDPPIAFVWISEAWDNSGAFVTAMGRDFNALLKDMPGSTEVATVYYEEAGHNETWVAPIIQLGRTLGAWEQMTMDRPNRFGGYFKD